MEIAENYLDRMYWKENNYYTLYKRPCGYTVGHIHQQRDGRYKAGLSSEEFTGTFYMFDHKKDAMAYVEEQFRKNGRLEPKTTVLRVKGMELAGYGEILIELAGDELENMVLYLTQKEVKTIVDWYN